MICPPKCATTMIMHVWRYLGFEERMPDHVPAWVMLSDLQKAGNPPMQWAMNVRHPEERLASMVNSQLYGRSGNPDHILDRVMLGEWILVKPQSWFLENTPDDLDLTLFPFAPHMPIVKWLGYIDPRGDVPVANRSMGELTIEELRALPGWKDALAMYDSDWALWEKVK